MIEDVQASIWINASAGSGKTKKLVDRIVALLRARVEPEKILCITYTKSAASEMDNRLHAAMEEFLREDQSLYEDLYRKRRLGQWVRIETIHSFAYSVLQQFSLLPLAHNSNVAADTQSGTESDFTSSAMIQACDDIERAVMCKRVIRKLLQNPLCAEHLREIAYFSNNLYEALIPNLSAIQRFFANHNIESVSDVSRFFSQLFSCEIRAFENVMKEFHARIFSLSDDLLHLAELLSNGNDSDREKSGLLKDFVQKRDVALLDIFYTQNGDLRKRVVSAILSKEEACTALIAKIVRSLEDTINVRNTYLSAAMNTHLFSLAYYCVAEYRREKEANACIDFEDIISCMIDVLKYRDDIRYQLDQSLEHILLDEAQDTSAEQWELIDLLAEEFWAHEFSLSCSKCRTLFVVGDHKQSIYSFQGADAKLFELKRLKYQEKILQAGGKFYELDSSTSYRSVPQVLNFVDQLQLFDGVAHHNHRQHTGCVEMWPSFDDEDSKIHAIVENIVHKLQHKCYVPSRGRTAQPEDFMLLFQRRNLTQMKKIIRSLRAHGIEVAGMDTIDLKDEMLVEDVLAMLEWLVDPQCDLALAQLLRTPLLRISNEKLHEYAYMRQGLLWDEIRSRASDANNVEEVRLYSILSAWRRYARQNSVYSIVLKIWSFVERIYMHLMGEYAQEVMRAFLDVIWQYQSKNVSNVYQFLQWFYERKFIYKRAPGNKHGVVFMTVHASKGLQAPFVYLVDCEFYNTSQEKMLSYRNCVLWDFSRNFRTPLIKQLKEMQKHADGEENKRLLYVALTRAEDFLYLIAQKKRGQEHSFAELLGMSAEKRVYGSHTYIAENHQESSALLEKGQGVPIDVMSLQERVLCDVDIVDESVTNAEASARDVGPQLSAQQRGEVMHKLLDMLPRVDGDMKFARCLLRQYGIDESHEAMQTVMHILSSKDFSWIFRDDETQHSYSEIEFIIPKDLHQLNSHNSAQTIRIDKMITHSANGEIADVHIIEYKSGIICDESMQKYQQQLHFYRQVVSACIGVDLQNIQTWILWLDERRLTFVE